MLPPLDLSAGKPSRWPGRIRLFPRFTRPGRALECTWMPGPAAHPLFADLSPELHSRLGSSARLLHVGPGTQLIREGDPGDGLYILIDGTVEIVVSTGHSRRRTLAVLGPGELFGEMSVLEERPRSAAVVARTEVSAWFIPREAVLSLIRQCPDLALRLLRELSRRLREFNRVYLEETLQMERLALLGRLARTIIHDLKSPLNVLQLAAEAGLHPQADVAQRAQAAERVRRQVERITDSVQEILLFTEGTAGQEMSLPTDYTQFLQSVLEELAGETELRQVQLFWDPTTWRHGQVRLQPRRLRRVLHNLVHNACDMMSTGGRIEVRLVHTTTSAVTEVHDNGPGIAPEIRDRLFDPFATYGKAHGTGLGLCICRKIVEDHGGTIEAGASDLGGAMFRFALPLVHTVPARPTACATE